MGFRVKKIVCGNAIIDLPSTRGKVTEAYLWPKLLERFSGNPAEKHLITVEVEDESLRKKDRKFLIKSFCLFYV